MPSCGPCGGKILVVEDFVPYTAERALISCGRTLRELTMILDVRYQFRRQQFGGYLELFNPVVLDVGEYLRLGHRDGNGRLICSDGWEGPHQPQF